jgi:hypothetical protein
MTKSTKNIHQTKKKKTNKKNKISWWKLVFSLFIIGALLLLFNYEPPVKTPKKKQTSSEPQFKKEGELSFFKKNSSEEITKINIEIADNNYERAQGLMYRNKMKENNGMLFIMKREEPQSFWMRNTYISLDIIFLNTEMEIVHIEKYTQISSDEPIPSKKNAKYILEVNAGFCNKYNINTGDNIKYSEF